MAGDEAADFALALAWDRLYGQSLWLPSDWQPSLDVSTSEMTTIRLELGDFGFDASNRMGKVQLTTTSLGPGVMTRLSKTLNSPLIHSVDQATEPPRFAVDEPRFDRNGVRLLAVAGQFGHQFTAPARKDSGGVVMMMPSPAPAIEDPDLAQSDDLMAR